MAVIAVVSCNYEPGNSAINVRDNDGVVPMPEVDVR
jgi:hypothetical protein